MTRSDHGPVRRGRLRGLAVNLLLSAATLLLFFGAVEGVLALLGAETLAASGDPFVGFEATHSLFEETPDGRLETASVKRTHFNRQSFPSPKGANVLRIFTLGGSTTYGRPYKDPTSFSAWLRAYLSAVAPDRSWEVINAGGISYASYRVALLMEELVDYEPDLFIVYSGNNEFLERRTYSDLLDEPGALRTTRSLLQRTRLWSLGRSLTDRDRQSAREAYELTGEVTELLNQSAGLDYYERDPVFHRQVMRHYAFNLQRMVDIARGAGARIVFVTVPVNESHFPPFKSQHDEAVDEAARAEVRTLLAASDRAAAQGEWPAAEVAARQAVAIDPLFADAHYRLGRALLAQGDTEPAEAAFTRAVEEDVCPLRATDEINELILSTATRNRTGLVDFREILETGMRDREGHSALGEAVFLDHVHPTVEAHGELARALVREISRLDAFELPPGRLESAQSRVDARILARVTPEATARAHKNLAKVLIWAGKNEEASRYVQLAEEALGDDWEVHFNAATVAMRERNDWRTALDRIDRALALKPEEARVWDLLAATHRAAGNRDEAVRAGMRAVELNPDSPSYWSNLSGFLREQGDAERALSAATQALRLDPEWANAWNNLGNLQFARGELAPALESYRKAISLRNDFVEAQTNAGLVLMRQERWDEAAALLRDAAASGSDALVARLALAQVLIFAGRPDEAVPWLDEAERLDPDNPTLSELRRQIGPNR